MSGTALYRALVAAGAPEDTAKEAAGEIDTIHSDIADIKERLTRLETILKMVLALVAANFLLMLKLTIS